MVERIMLEHGAGGRLMHELVDEISRVVKTPARGVDKAVLKSPGGLVAFTTDSFVMKPPFVEGCDIGMLSVYGTVNDLVTMGAKPEYLSLSLIIEEGLEKSFLIRIIESISLASSRAGVRVVTGDVKVVEKGGCDKVFINTSGIGRVYPGFRVSTMKAKPGDAVIVTGSIGEHGAAVLAARGEFQLDVDVSSDCTPLTGILEALVRSRVRVHTLIDPTRGGLATSLNEVAESSCVAIEVHEDMIPVRESVSSLCELLGIEPFYLGCEGRLVIMAPESQADRIIRVLKRLEISRDSRVIGRVVGRSAKGEVRLITKAGGVRNLPMLHGIPLPRIC
ncbi:MAG: hydrogenase expression/formation protein HypE [Thermoproteota archaeon]